MPISRTDWFRAQLQAQLQRRAREGASVSSESTRVTTAGSPPSAQVPLSRLAALRSRQVSDAQILVSALLEDLLGEEIGAGMENDPEYHQAIGVVLHELRSDPELWALCMRVLDET